MSDNLKTLIKMSEGIREDDKVILSNTIEVGDFNLARVIIEGYVETNRSMVERSLVNLDLDWDDSPAENLEAALLEFVIILKIDNLIMKELNV